MVQNWFIYWIFEGMHYIMQIKDFLDGNIESSIIFNLEEISLHKEGPTATIILLYSLPVIWFSLLDVGSYNFAAYVYRKNVLFNNRSDLDGAILDENDNSSGRYCCSRRVLIARRWKQFYHSMHPSRIDCRCYRRRNLPWGQPLSYHGHGTVEEFWMQEKTTSSENSSVEVQSKHSPEEIPVWSHPCTIEYSIPLRRSEFGLSDVRECHSYLQGEAFDQWFCTRI